MMKKTWIILIIVMILLGLAGGLLWYFKFRPRGGSPELLKVSPSLRVTPSIDLSPPAISPKVTSTPTNTQTIKIFMIALDDNGKSGKKIGCDDSAVAVEKTIPTTQAVLKATLEELLKVKTKYYGESGLYNPLSQADLKLESVAIENSQAIIKFSGSYSSIGTCEDPRFEAQLKETALQFSTVKEVQIFINDKELSEIFLQEG